MSLDQTIVLASSLVGLLADVVVLVRELGIRPAVNPLPTHTGHRSGAQGHRSHRQRLLTTPGGRVLTGFLLSYGCLGLALASLAGAPGNFRTYLSLLLLALPLWTVWTALIFADTRGARWGRGLTGGLLIAPFATGLAIIVAMILREEPVPQEVVVGVSYFVTVTVSSLAIWALLMTLFYLVGRRR